VADGSFTTRFSWLDGVSRDPRMRGLPLAIAIQFAANYFNSNTGAAWPAQKTLARRLGADRRSIQRALNTLIEAGWLRRERVSGGRKSNRYWMQMGGADAGGADAPRNGGVNAAKGAVSTPPDLGEVSRGISRGDTPLVFEDRNQRRGRLDLNNRTGFRGAVSGLARWRSQRNESD
jgi:Helix-turn-helix domain